MISMKNFIKYSLFLIIILQAACSKKNFSSKPVYNFNSSTGVPDYSSINYWAAHPWKWDPSDSVPKPLKHTFIKDSVVDVFFLYPTTFTDKEDTAWNAPIDYADLNAKTDYSAILYQASVFNQHARVFAPRYRQAHYRSFGTSEKLKAKQAFDLAYSDVKSAFDYYLEHYNNGRPIIIASHSQGTLHAVRLLQDYFDGKKLQNKLVAAYTIGLPVKETDFKQIKPCTDPDRTGCVVSWRTYEKGYEGQPYINREDFKVININPLSFRMDTAFVSSDQNMGGMLRNFNKLTPGLVDAQVHKNILWVSKPKFFGNVFLKTKNYHIADYNFFYRNIVSDVEHRIGVYWKQ